MKIITIIPARMGSSRFPGKPMAKILGKPMIAHVYQNVKNTPGIEKTVVATCDKEIHNHILSLGGISVMTSNEHERASDRCAEALKIVESSENDRYDLMVMVQGDEPLIKSEMITEAIQPFFRDNKIIVTNLYSEIEKEEEFINPNCIKVVMDNDENALYFSRSPIPNNKKFKIGNSYKQICVIPFRRDYLETYNKLCQTTLEIQESVDMLRILENGQKIKMVKTKYKLTHAVDHPDDIAIVENLLKKRK
jgi:3-deoxy-manno-octulosonate cytidylyltransferase (CMP-KDO synthetase)